MELPAAKLRDASVVMIYKKRDLLGDDRHDQLPILNKGARFLDIRVETSKKLLGERWGTLGIVGSEN